MSETLILCATTRLAQTLRGELPSGLAVWRTPRTATLAQWLAEQADAMQVAGDAELPAPLDPYAERLLWERVVAASLDAASPLFDLPAMAAAAADAQALCRTWGLAPAAVSDECRLFAAWQADFERRCRAAGWLDAAGFQAEVIARIEAGRGRLPETMQFAGFDRPTPLELRLRRALAARGVAVGELPPGQPGAGDARRLECADRAAECAAAVAWARQRLAADPQACLGIVAPDLAGVRDRLEFLLEDVFHPAAVRPAAAGAPRCFNFSLGRPLADQPLVATGLELLAVVGSRGALEQSRWSALLLGGGWGSEAEADGRAGFDLALRRDLPYFTTAHGVLRLARRLGERGEMPCPNSVAALGELLARLEAWPRKQLPGAWAAAFRDALKTAGWPGDRALSSHEFQATRAFAELLAGFGRFDALLGPVGFAEAVRRLRELCRQRLFQPETRGRPAIQVLGVLESAGLEFDGLWVIGMNDDQWPPAPRPSPLLPADAQRTAGAAHASAEVELDFAQRVQARLLRSAPEVRFSYARADGNRVLRPSPLLAGLPGAGEAPVPPPTLAATLAAAAGCERLADDRAPPVGPGEKVAGGSWLLRAQAICPAWAYFQYRLGAEAVDEPVEGLDPAARGTLVHAALEAFWRATGDSARLAVLGAGRDGAVADAVRAALDAYEAERRIALPARFRELEAGRLKRLLGRWLDVESRRGRDFSVVACEQPAEVEIEGIRVRMVVDRIDRLADGRRVIIDYKTGRAIDVANWAGERLTEPQLPIYAALVADEVAAVVFAKVLPDKPAFAGVADEADLLPGVAGLGDERQKLFDPALFPDWPAVVAHWRERLHAVAREVGDGVAGVAFADEGALKYCEVLPLLRLPERRRLLAEAGIS